MTASLLLAQASPHPQLLSSPLHLILPLAVPLVPLSAPKVQLSASSCCSVLVVGAGFSAERAGSRQKTVCGGGAGVDSLTEGAGKRVGLCVESSDTPG